MDAQRAPDASGHGRPGRLLAGGAVVVGVLLVVLVALAVATASPGLWVVALLVAGLGLAGAAVLLARAPEVPTVPRGGPPAPQVGAGPEREVDDLQAFFDAPPGSSPTPEPAPATPTATVVEGPGPARGPGGSTGAAHRSVAVLATAAVVLVAAAGTVAVLTDDGDSGPDRGRHRSSVSDTTADAGRPGAPTGSRPAEQAPTATATPLVAAEAGGLADADVAPGDDGLTARLTFEGIVLEPRAVGATVTYPTLEVSSDGTNSVAHLELPTWNCLTASPSAERAAAGCTASLTEYADLPSPALELRAEDGEFELTGTFETYTRPNGSAPTYTGRSYTVTVQAGPDGRVQDGRAPAAGELELGGATADTTTDRRANIIELSD